MSAQTASRICPSCGAHNKVTAQICSECLSSLVNVKPGAVVATPKQSYVMRLLLVDPVSRQLTQTALDIPEQDRDYLVGRSDGPHTVDIDLKAVAQRREVAGTAGRSGFLISRSHATLSRRGRRLEIVLHPQSSKALYIWPAGNSTSQIQVTTSKPEQIKHGDVVVFGNPQHPQSVIVQVSFS